MKKKLQSMIDKDVTIVTVARVYHGTLTEVFTDGVAIKLHKHEDETIIPLTAVTSVSYWKAQVK